MAVARVARPYQRVTLRTAERAKVNAVGRNWVTTAAERVGFLALGGARVRTIKDAAVGRPSAEVWEVWEVAVARVARPYQRVMWFGGEGGKTW